MNVSVETHSFLIEFLVCSAEFSEVFQLNLYAMERKNDLDDHKLNGIFDECAFGVNLSYKQYKELFRTCNLFSAKVGN